MYLFSYAITLIFRVSKNDMEIPNLKMFEVKSAVCWASTYEY